AQELILPDPARGIVPPDRRGTPNNPLDFLPTSVHEHATARHDPGAMEAVQLPRHRSNGLPLVHDQRYCAGLALRCEPPPCPSTRSCSHVAHPIRPSNSVHSIGGSPGLLPAILRR